MLSVPTLRHVVWNAGYHDAWEPRHDSRTMKLYGGIDLHSSNNVVVLSDEEDKVVYRRRLPNDTGVVLAELGAFRQDIEGLVVESTYNWYWLVDGLMDVGFSVHLANTAAIVQYEGLKYADDESDARWLAKLLRLGLLPEGYIYPRQERAVRDLLRRRSKLVQQHSANLQSIQNLLTRSRGCSLSANQVKRLTDDEVDRLLPDADVALAVKGNLAVMRTQAGVIELLEKRVKGRTKLHPTLCGRKSWRGHEGKGRPIDRGQLNGDPFLNGCWIARPDPFLLLFVNQAHWRPLWF
jgi:transposase